jgi:hypothetical protein
MMTRVLGWVGREGVVGREKVWREWREVVGVWACVLAVRHMGMREAGAMTWTWS